MTGWDDRAETVGVHLVEDHSGRWSYHVCTCPRVEGQIKHLDIWGANGYTEIPQSTVQRWFLTQSLMDTMQSEIQGTYEHITKGR